MIVRVVRIVQANSEHIENVENNRIFKKNTFPTVQIKYKSAFRIGVNNQN